MSSRQTEVTGRLRNLLGSEDVGQTYLHRNVEVKTTGRVARKEQKTRRSKKEVELHEVTPVNQENGSWMDWVDLDGLYKIEDESDC